MAGNRARGSARNAPNLSQACRHFQERGTCHFGTRCRFSHNTAVAQGNYRENDKRGGSSVAPSPGPRPRNPGIAGASSPAGGSNRRSQQAGDGKLREWKRLLDQGSQLTGTSPATVGRVFQLGLELMDGDLGAAQEAMKLLAKDDGLSFIKYAMDRQIPIAQASGGGVGLWDAEIKPLFQLITHPNVVDSAVLEQQVATVFNYLYGVGGDRMTRTFRYITQLVKSWPSSDDRASRTAAVELALAVLSKILDCNTTTIVNDEFSSLAASFSECLSQPFTDDDDFSRLQALKYLDYIRLRLSVGEEIPTTQNLPQAPVAREKFLLRRDLPGHLSSDGPRHDNDNVHISKIKILPTYDEIMSPRAEYLPTVDSSQWHLEGIRGRLDREFRLLREDTVGQLRDAIWETLESVRTQQDGLSTRSKNSARTYTYDFPTPELVYIDRVGGLEFVLRCNQHPAVRKLNEKKRKDWWMQSKRLQSGALVCVLDATGSVLFFVVSDSTMRSVDDKQARPPPGGEDDVQAEASNVKQNPLTLSDNKDFLFVRLRLIEPTKNELMQVLRWYRNVRPSRRRYLVEFPGVLLPSFKDTLAALQQMYEKPNMPFGELLAPSADSSAPVKLNPPQYARKAGFTFDLSCLTRGSVSFNVSPQNLPSSEKLASLSDLDSTQSEALLNTLSRELSLIQGPPGTGKSYTGEKLIKVLLSNKEKANLGPILCVCYTNHALDQLLEHLLDDGVKGVIRIGSRSKSERLRDLNLRTVVKEFDRTRSEKSQLYQAEECIRQLVPKVRELLLQLSGSNSWRAIKSFLATNSQKHHDELFGDTEDGFKVVNYQPENNIRQWLSGGYVVTVEPRPLAVLQEVQLSAMTNEERQAMHSHWIKSIRDPIIKETISLHEDFVAARGRRDRFRGSVDLRCLQRADIVGVTTTGLAKNLDLLRRLRCKVMLCEEAGEVLEAHILTALLPSVEHAILIGDHLQLRPQIQNYELQSTNPRGEQYSLDCSLFERLVQPPATDMSGPGIPFSVLETQRRMYPSIAELVRSTLYPRLKDGDKVLKYPGVVGMRKRLFWLHHDVLEAGAANHDPLSTSHANDFEVEMTATLVSHLVRQGEYLKTDIAVITPYLGQLQRLRRRMETMFEICLNERDLEDLEAVESAGDPGSAVTLSPRAQVGKTTLLNSIRIATVDNFQGEEAKIVIISLVRSNPQNNCGFLRTSNRINVLLSRAQHGMYIIGNSNTYQSIPMWADVISILQRAGNFGTSLELQCPRHPGASLAVSQPEHFLTSSPDGGCNLPCEKRLHCGHSCTGRCHSDILHNSVKCQAACPQSKEGCDHACPLRCGDPCHVKCQKQLKDLDLILQCGHRVSSAKCWEAQDPSSIRCMVRVSRRIPGCNHVVKVRCHEDITASTYRCVSRCGHHRTCGHECPSPCYICNTRKDGLVTKTDHGICTVNCGRGFSTCQHSCRLPCHSGDACPPCNHPCEVRCNHSKCNKLCHEPCAPCAEHKCGSRCVHSQCTMPCAAPCNWVPCSKRCGEMLDCGHQCPSLCGEPCPTSAYCQQCGSDQVKSTRVDFLEMKEYQEVNLDDDPCIFPDCGHFLTVSSMDGQMDMAAHYHLDINGLPVAIPGATLPFSVDSSVIKTCPSCRGSLRSISRYGRVIRRGMLDESTKRFIAWSNTEYLNLARRLVTEQEKLQDTAATRNIVEAAGKAKRPNTRIPRLRHLHNIEQQSEGYRQYSAIISLWKEISAFESMVQKEEQPFQRVADLIKHANRQNRTSQEFQFDESVIQVKGCLLSASLLLKCEAAIFADFVQLLSRKVIPPQAKKGIKINWSIYEKACASLIESARDSHHPKEEVQGHILAAQMHAFSWRVSSADGDQPQTGIMTDPTTEAREAARRQEAAMKHIEKARVLLDKYPSTALLRSELERVTILVNDGVFYGDVTKEELRDVYKAMSREFFGTGHWYICANGHPFTVGECGMPMERACCPECGAPVGGTNHQAAEGVQHAAEIEQLVGGITGLELGQG